MITEVFIENYRLDISESISTLLTFAIDDIKHFSARSTTWSKTVVLPGTQNNNKLFGHIFEIGQSNGFNDMLDNVNFNFNASKAADCIIFQDQLQTFKGVLRLMQINITNGQIEYEVALFGELAGLNVALSGGLLEELDFSAYDHNYNASGIVASWANTSGVGVYYPLIDYGAYSILKADWDIRTFRPALHVREYIDKMITAAGFRWRSDLFDTPRFKRLIIPHNQKKLYSTADNYLQVDVATTQSIPFTAPNDRVNFATVVTNNGFTGTSDDTFNYDDPPTINPVITVTLAGNVLGNLTAQLMRLRGVDPPEIMASVPVAGVSLAAYSVVMSAQVELQQNDDIYVIFTGFNLGDVVTISSGSLLVAPGAGVGVEISIGDTVVMNSTIPKNIRQIDFLLGIIKLFNLYAYESLNDSRLIYFKPYVDFYSTDSTDSVNWTYKLNRDKTIKIRPMSELTAKKYEFKFKSDSDFFNEQYRKRYGQGYGDHIFDSQFEFAEQTKAFEVIFSATPLVGYSGEDKVFPTIFKQSNGNEENIDSNIRIMQSKLIVGVTSWDITDGIGGTVLASETSYGYAGHFDDPDAPANDLNFGALRELFFALAAGDLTVTQFNVYWSAYMAEITDKDSKLLSAWFYLTVVDILNLDFSKKVFIDGNLFRLNSIKDYNVSEPGDCEVELLKINYLIY
jgi:hypothetical protein